jgi:hypothetical protein
MLRQTISIGMKYNFCISIFSIYFIFATSCNFNVEGLPEGSSIQCSDSVLNGNETDIDCGGDECNSCIVGKSCLQDSDCSSNFCDETSHCAMNDMCLDNEQNGNETDADCGGNDCPPCEDDKSCLVGDDCISKICDNNKCVAPSCSDSLINGNESDTDCGGNECEPCTDGESCIIATDCISEICSDENICTSISCTDILINGTETDVDCGGGGCPPCITGQSCIEGTDCESTVCNRSLQCTLSVCFDGVTNGNETDIDCGGSDCLPCVDGESCILGSDCQSLVCNNINICATPTCDDSAANGDETDLNCGGETCVPCIAGESCLLDRDCDSGGCNSLHICNSAICTDGMQNSDETDVDCGGSLCPGCQGDKICNTNFDCASGYCNPEGLCKNQSSCKALYTLVPSIATGYYLITTSVATTFVYCDIQNNVAYTFHYTSSGISTSNRNADDSCKTMGLMLFTPINETHYGYARDYALAVGASTDGDFLGPLGIYNPDDGDDFGWNQWCEHDDYCCEKRMAGGGGNDTVSDNDCGFTSIAGNTFWASDNTGISEPNGDYDSNCWLNFVYNASGDVAAWNDDDCNYSYSDYMCMATDDTP